MRSSARTTTKTKTTTTTTTDTTSGSRTTGGLHHNHAGRFVVIHTVVTIMISRLSFIICWLYKALMNWWHRWTDPVITLDRGIQVRVGPQLGEGGFSLVFQAELVSEGNNTNTNNVSNKDSRLQPHRKYALKRIFVGSDEEIRQGCLKEVEVHHAAHHPNLLALLGFLKTNEYCYMLFPLCKTSLRQEVNRRTGILDELSTHYSKQDAPWSELQALQMFVRICCAVQALHEARYTHRDIKLENILLAQDSVEMEPMLMDFGSAGPLAVTLTTRNDAMSAVELAAQQTTLPYRPPELLDTTGMLRVGDTLDYRAVDVWSLGCTLFGILYGASPFECDFRRNGACGARIVECTTLRIINHKIPTPPPESPSLHWYSDELTQDLIPSMIQQDPQHRPTIPYILARLSSMIEARGGHIPSQLLPTAIAPLEQEVVDHLDDDDDDGFSQFYSSTNNPV